MISKDLTNNKWDDILVNFDTDVHLRLGQNKGWYITKNVIHGLLNQLYLNKLII